MSLRYSLWDLVEIAVQIEFGGERFYRYAAERNEKLRDAFLFLADEDKKHAVIFQGLLHPGYEGPGGFDIKEAIPYVRAIVDSSVLRYLTERREFPEKVVSVSAALEFALGLEKESILFYYELLERIKEKEKTTVEKIIEEEKKHIEKIMALKALAS